MKDSLITQIKQSRGSILNGCHPNDLNFYSVDPVSWSQYCESHSTD